MTIIFLSSQPLHAAQAWIEALRAALPDDEIAAGPAPEAEIAVVSSPPAGALAAHPNLKFIQSTWAGVDGLMADPTLPRNVPLARLIDPELSAQMAEAVATHVLALHRQIPTYRAQQEQEVWRQLPQPPASARRIGLLGHSQRAIALDIGHSGTLASGRHELASTRGQQRVSPSCAARPAAPRGYVQATRRTRREGPKSGERVASTRSALH